ncbi:MAG: hypothetical protein WBX16_08275, partial [Candidatus Acidiferrales bacterium]
MKSTTVRTTIATALGFLALSAVAAGQDLAAVASAAVPQLPVTSSPRPKPPLVLSYESKYSVPRQAATTAPAPSKADAELAASRGVARRITLEEAQLRASSASNNPLVRLGQLQVEVARQNRLGTLSTFFPQIGSSLENMHFNKFMGQELQVADR